MKIADVEVNHPDKILFPRAAINKRRLAGYYAGLASTILPYLKDRPLTLERYPDGIDREGFFQKQLADYFPDYIHSINLDNASIRGSTRYPLCQDRRSLVYLAQLATITPHRWLSRCDRPDEPDLMVFDLDPSPGNSFDDVINAAKSIRNIVVDTGLSPYVMTTGSRGLHVITPLQRRHGFNTVRDRAAELAGEVVSNQPEQLTTEIRKDKRDGRLFIDIARNARGQTVVCPYAVRARDHAPVATPLDWEELDRPDLRADRYTINTINRRLARKKDPWRGIHQQAGYL